MNNSPDEFEDLRKLLALKRHEQPPPGYFRSFSNRVISAIEQEESVPQLTWWESLFQRFDARPILACAYGFVMSGLLIAGFRVAQVIEDDHAGNNSGAPGPWLADSLSPRANASLFNSQLSTPAPLNSQAVFVSQPGLDTPPNLRFGNSGFQVRPASFSFAY